MYVFKNNLHALLDMGMPIMFWSRENVASKRRFINLFHATGLFLYPLKTSENQRFSDVSMGHRK